jgi:hypothetical protein
MERRIYRFAPVIRVIAAAALAVLVAACNGGTGGNGLY